jgi:hypothetical protein
MGLANAIGIVTLALVALMCQGLSRATLGSRRVAARPGA